MIIPQEGGPARYLAELRPGDLVQVRFVAFEFVSTDGWDLPIRPGDVLQYIDGGVDGITVARADGSRILVPEDCARLIGVKKTPPHYESLSRPRPELAKGA